MTDLHYLPATQALREFRAAHEERMPWLDMPRRRPAL
jgi:hypothetical protein